MTLGIRADESVRYDGFRLALTVDSADCSNYNYLIFGVLADNHTPHLEEYLDNNYDVRANTFVCTGMLSCNSFSRCQCEQCEMSTACILFVLSLLTMNV